MLRKLLISLIILHVKLVAMENLTTLNQNVQEEKSPSNATEAATVKNRLLLGTNKKSSNAQLLKDLQKIQPSKQSRDETTESSSTHQDEEQTEQDDSSYVEESSSNSTETLNSSSEQSLDETTEISSTGENQQTKKANSSYLEGTNEVNTFLKELQTGHPEADDDVVPFKSASEYLKKLSLVEEGLKNETYYERFVYLPAGGSDIVPCFDRLDLKSTVKSITHSWVDNLGKDLKKRRHSRLRVDERYRLSITDAQTDDVGVYHCHVAVIYSDRVDGLNIDNVVSLNVYVNPDLALEFPFIFDSTTCNHERDRKKLSDIKAILCTMSPCVYEFEMVCSTEPWQHANMPYIPRSKLLILVTKYPDPDYKPPECNRDCLMANKFTHLTANLGMVQKVVDMTTNDTNLTFFSGLTMSNRKLVYSCGVGFSLFRESCVPCFPGTYNPKKRMNLCVPCRINTYIAQPGAQDCLLCASDKKTETVGADSIKKCVDKEVKIIRFRMAFYIVCGVVGGILGILLAVCIVKCRDKIKKSLHPAGNSETTDESSKLVTANKVTDAENSLHTEKKPSSKKLSAVIVQPENLQEARERLRKTSDEKNGTIRQDPLSNGAAAAAAGAALTTQSKERLENKAMERKKRKSESKLDVVTKQPSIAVPDNVVSQPEGEAKPDKLKKKGSHMSNLIRESVQSVASMAAEYTLPAAPKKKSKLSKKSKVLVGTQPQLYDLARASQQRMQGSFVSPSDALIASSFQLHTGSAMQPFGMPDRKSVQPAGPSEQTQDGSGFRLPPGTSDAQATALPVGQTQPSNQPGQTQPSDQPGQSKSNISSAIPSAQQTQINPPQPQQAVNDQTQALQTQALQTQALQTQALQTQALQTQALQTAALTQPSATVEAAAGQERAISKNLNQNSAFVNDSSSRGPLKRKSLEMNYAETSNPMEEQTFGGQRFAELTPPHYLYDQIFWMPNAIMASSSPHTNVPTSDHGKASFAAQKTVSGYGHESGSQAVTVREQEQNTYVASGYTLQDSLQSQRSRNSSQQPIYYRNSWPAYLTMRQQQQQQQQGHRDKATGLQK